MTITISKLPNKIWHNAIVPKSTQTATMNRNSYGVAPFCFNPRSIIRSFKNLYIFTVFLFSFILPTSKSLWYMVSFLLMKPPHICMSHLKKTMHRPKRFKPVIFMIIIKNKTTIQKQVRVTAPPVVLTNENNDPSRNKFSTTSTPPVVLCILI